MTSSFSTGPKQPKLLDRVRAAVRVNHYSPRTEQAYVDWIERFIRFHGIRHPHEMGAEEVRAFLTHLATELNVDAEPSLFGAALSVSRGAQTAPALD